MSEDDSDDEKSEDKVKSKTSDAMDVDPVDEKKIATEEKCLSDAKVLIEEQTAEEVTNSVNTRTETSDSIETRTDSVNSKVGISDSGAENTESVDQVTKSSNSEQTSDEVNLELRTGDITGTKSESGEGKTDVETAKQEEEKAEEVIDAKNETEDLIEVEDTDDYLLYLEDILKLIHKSYYEIYDSGKKENPKENCIPDLKEIIPEVKQKVLKDCNLVFSGLVPSHTPLQQSRAYMVAVSLGATVSADVSAACTHLVAARPGTAKINSSRRHKGIMIVTPLWLWHCAERWERLDERLFPLGKDLGVVDRVTKFPRVIILK